MPEGLEAELYRRAAERCLGRRVAAVVVDARQSMADDLPCALLGREFEAARRVGKMVFLDLAGDCTGPAAVLGLHFGMTGRLIVDGDAPIDELVYGSVRDDPAWDRFVVTFDDGGVLRVNDPRRWATFVLDPAENRLGPDFLSVRVDHLVTVFARRRAAVKAVLLDQSVVAGYGNLCVDEVLWQAGISPLTPARDLPRSIIEHMHRIARWHLPRMLAAGGSHRGTIDPTVRAELAPCPRDGEPLRRDTVGGRTTIWCAHHQIDRWESDG